MRSSKFIFNIEMYQYPTQRTTIIVNTVLHQTSQARQARQASEACDICEAGVAYENINHVLI